MTAEDGAAWWEVAGRRFPVIAGGDDGDGAGEQGGKPDPDADKGKGGAGDGGKPDPDDDGDGAGESEKERRLRAEARAQRQRAKAAEEERDRLKAATQSEAEKAAERAERAEARATAATERLRASELRSVAAEEARELGVTDLRAALKLMDRDAIEWDEDTDEPSRKSVQKALAAAVKEFPSLRGRGDVDAGARSDSRPDGNSNQQMNSILRAGRGRG